MISSNILIFANTCAANTVRPFETISKKFALKNVRGEKHCHCFRLVHLRAETVANYQLQATLKITYKDLSHERTFIFLNLLGFSILLKNSTFVSRIQVFLWMVQYFHSSSVFNRFGALEASDLSWMVRWSLQEVSAYLCQSFPIASWPYP